MNIGQLLYRSCKQTAVYWGNPQSDGYGGETFDSPVEIKCRWEDKVELSRDNTEREFTQKAEVYVLQDLNKGGWLYLGELSDLDSNPDDPKQVEGAYIIGQFDKIPDMKGKEFIRKAYIGWQKVA